MENLDPYGTYLGTDGVATHNADIFAKEFWGQQIELLCSLNMENTEAFQQTKAKILTRTSMDQSFVRDMEQGGYCAETTNAARRLNDVIRKYERIIMEAEAREPAPEPPRLVRQNARRSDDNQ